MTTLREEIKEALNNFYGEMEGINVPPIMKEEHDKHTNQILKLIEKRIDSIKPHPKMENYHIIVVNYTKDKMKEMLK